MKCHNNSELTPVCSYHAEFLGARWALCDHISVDYFISYIWDSKWPPRMPQERGTASQMGEPTFTRDPSGAEGMRPAIPKCNLKVHTHQCLGETFRTQNELEINNNQSCMSAAVGKKKIGKNKLKQIISIFFSSLGRCSGNKVLYFSFEIMLWPSSYTPLDAASGPDKETEMVWGMPAKTTASGPLSHFISINGMGCIGVK